MSEMNKDGHSVKIKEKDLDEASLEAAPDIHNPEDQEEASGDTGTPNNSKGQ
jgi:hypothetical protein